ncbi:MAG: hypothetical protein JRD89_19220 [Deltaproteobacteria bacterium]|nr:hypothetical protein [Deltaproteobacteria bacterium]
MMKAEEWLKRHPKARRVFLVLEGLERTGLVRKLERRELTPEVIIEGPFWERTPRGNRVRNAIELRRLLPHKEKTVYECRRCGARWTDPRWRWECPYCGSERVLEVAK